MTLASYNELNPATFYWNVKPWTWVVMYMCIKVSILYLPKILLLDFWTVLTVWYLFWISCYILKIPTYGRYLEQILFEVWKFKTLCIYIFIYFILTLIIYTAKKNNKKILILKHFPWTFLILITFITFSPGQ